MVDVKIGTKIPKDALKSGVTKDGKKWLVGAVKADKGYDQIDVWAVNPEVGTDSEVEVVSINAVKKSARKYTDKEGNEKWADVYSINAILKATETIPEGFSQLSEEDIPF